MDLKHGKTIQQFLKYVISKNNIHFQPQNQQIQQISTMCWPKKHIKFIKHLNTSRSSHRVQLVIQLAITKTTVDFPECRYYLVDIVG